MISSFYTAISNTSFFNAEDVKINEEDDAEGPEGFNEAPFDEWFENLGVQSFDDDFLVEENLDDREIDSADDLLGDEEDLAKRSKDSSTLSDSNDVNFFDDVQEQSDEDDEKDEEKESDEEEQSQVEEIFNSENGVSVTEVDESNEEEDATDFNFWSTDRRDSEGDRNKSTESKSDNSFSRENGEDADDENSLEENEEIIFDDQNGRLSQDSRRSDFGISEFKEEDEESERSESETTEDDSITENLSYLDGEKESIDDSVMPIFESDDLSGTISFSDFLDTLKMTEDFDGFFESLAEDFTREETDGIDYDDFKYGLHASDAEIEDFYFAVNGRSMPFTDAFGEDRSVLGHELGPVIL